MTQDQELDGMFAKLTQDQRRALHIVLRRVLIEKDPEALEVWESEDEGRIARYTNRIRAEVAATH